MLLHPRRFQSNILLSMSTLPIRFFLPYPTPPRFLSSRCLSLLPTLPPCGTPFRKGGGFHRFGAVSAVTTNGAAVDLVQQETEIVKTRLLQLKTKLESEGIHCEVCKPGHHKGMVCPKAPSDEKGHNLAPGQSSGQPTKEKGHSLALGPSSKQITKQNAEQKIYRTVTEEELGLEPLCQQIIFYFAAMMISAGTLHRNAVMQREYNNKISIAFTYRRDGKLVNCKYRGAEKKFWQERVQRRYFMDWMI